MDEATKRKVGRPPGSTGGPLAHKLQRHNPTGVYVPRNRRTSEQRAVETYVSDLVEEVIKSGVELPLPFLMRVYNDDAQDISIRIEAARVVMPYIHRKMPVALESTDTKRLELVTLQVTADTLASLDDDELEVLGNFAKRIAESRADSGGAQAPEAVEAEEVLPGHGATAEGALPEAPGVLPSGESAP